MQEATMTMTSWLLHSFWATFFKLPSSFCAVQKVQNSSDTSWHVDMRTCLGMLGSPQERNKLIYAKGQRAVSEVGMGKKVSDFLPGSLQLRREYATEDIAIEYLLDKPLRGPGCPEDTDPGGRQQCQLDAAASSAAWNEDDHWPCCQLTAKPMQSCFHVPQLDLWSKSPLKCFQLQLRKSCGGALEWLPELRTQSTKSLSTRKDTTNFCALWASEMCGYNKAMLPV